MEKQIICPNCGARITFMDGTIVEGCVACQTRFINPGHVAVKATDATVVPLDPLSSKTVNGGAL